MTSWPGRLLGQLVPADGVDCETVEEPVTAGPVVVGPLVTAGGVDCETVEEPVTTGSDVVEATSASRRCRL